MRTLNYGWTELPLDYGRITLLFFFKNHQRHSRKCSRPFLGSDPFSAPSGGCIVARVTLSLWGGGLQTLPSFLQVRAAAFPQIRLPAAPQAEVKIGSRSFPNQRYLTTVQLLRASCAVYLIFFFSFFSKKKQHSIKILLQKSVPENPDRCF